MKVLCVCLGNICRSPLAQGVLQHKALQNQLDWEVDSAGTSGRWNEGYPPDPRSIAVARENGIDLSTQRARQLTADDLDRYDLILVMDQQNYDDVLELITSDIQQQKVRMLLSYLPEIETVSLKDPYSGNDAAFYHVYSLIDQATDMLIESYTRNTADESI